MKKFFHYLIVLIVSFSTCAYGTMVSNRIWKSIYIFNKCSYESCLKQSNIISFQANKINKMLYSTTSTDFYNKLSQHLKSLNRFKDVDSANLQIRKLDGWTNENFQIKTSKDSFVLRVPRPGSEQFLDRQAEKRNITLASQLGITPAWEFFDEKTGILLRPYLEGEILVDDNDHVMTSDLRDMVEILKALHTGTPIFNNKVDNFDIIQLYKSLIEKEKGNWAKRHDKIFEEMKTVQQILNHPKFPQVSCHNDPNPRNFLKLLNNKMMLLDFEYGGKGNPFFDVAYLATHANVNEEQEQIILQTYFKGTPKPAELAQYHIFKPYTEYILAVWLRMQITLKNAPIDFEEMEGWEELCLSETERLIQHPTYSSSRQILLKEEL